MNQFISYSINKFLKSVFVSWKISAQESRRKKKEYMDALERKVEVLTGENTDYKKKIESLEESNASLLSQLQKLQALVARSSTASTTGTSNRVIRHTDTTTFTSVSSQKSALKCAGTNLLFLTFLLFSHPLLLFSSSSPSSSSSSCFLPFPLFLGPYPVTFISQFKRPLSSNHTSLFIL